MKSDGSTPTEVKSIRCDADLLDLLAGVISDNYRFPGARDGSPTGSAINSEFIAERVVVSLRSYGLLGELNDESLMNEVQAPR